MCRALCLRSEKEAVCPGVAHLAAWKARRHSSLDYPDGVFPGVAHPAALKELDVGVAIVTVERVSGCGPSGCVEGTASSAPGHTKSACVSGCGPSGCV